MKYTNLGNTGLRVSRLALGCWSYGEPTRGGNPWSLGKDESEPFFRQALDAGINFFDTANVYSAGSSEEIMGETLMKMVPREELVIATKLCGPMRPGPNGRGLSRKAIMSEVDNSLARLGTDYIDLYQTHRWDRYVPIEETMEALHDLVKAGKVRYIGGSTMHAWQFAKAQFVADQHSWTRFATMQNLYNLLYREEEREMNPFCVDQKIGILPWSPLARGILARPWVEETVRSETDEISKQLRTNDDRPVVEAVQELAAKRGVAAAQIALAWVLTKPGVSSPIIGATKEHHLTTAIDALDVQLDIDEVAALEANYRPHRELSVN